MMKRYDYILKSMLLIILFGQFSIQFLQAQNVVVSDDQAYTGEATAILDVKSTDKGMLVPRLSTAQRTSISSPVEGLFVYDSDLKHFYFFNGSNWVSMPIANAHTTDTSFVITQRLLFEGDAIVWDDLRVPVESTQKGDSNYPTFDKFLDDDSDSQGVWVQYFDQDDEEELFFTVQLPHSYKSGTDIQPHVHWSCEKDDSGDVVWGLEYTWANMSEIFQNTTIITGTGSNTNSYQHNVTSLGLIDGTGQTCSSMLICRIFREADDSSDDLDREAALLEIDFHFQVQSLGTHYSPSK